VDSVSDTTGLFCGVLQAAENKTQAKPLPEGRRFSESLPRAAVLAGRTVLRPLGVDDMKGIDDETVTNVMICMYVLLSGFE
jgi:hypothetical protein